MDPLLILSQLEVLIQFNNYVSQFNNPILKILSELWIQITRIYIFPRICH